jgi:asparagine synthase (glutamine-hydrolysing)
MASTLAAESRKAPTFLTAESNSLALVGSGAAGSTYQDETTIAIIEGEPFINDTTLANLAKHEGMAKALVRGYEDYGIDVLQRLQGSFCLAVLHHKKQTGFLAVDRFAMRPLTYTLVDGSLLFASTASAVRSHPLIETTTNNQAIFDYLYFHVVPGPESVFEGLQRLLPGQYILFSKGTLKCDSYWQIRYCEDTSAKFGDLKRKFFDLLHQSVQRFVDDRNIGSFLSGGTDSSTVAGMLARVTGEPPCTYSVGFHAPGYDEIAYARIAARHFGARYQEYYVTPDDVASAVQRIAAAYDNPYGNSSAVPVYYCARLAKENGTDKLLAGDGGDELFGGNARYAKQWLFSLYSDLPQLVRHRLIEPLLYGIPAGDKIWPLRKVRSYIQQASVPMPGRLETYNLLGRLGVHNVLTPEFLEDIDSRWPLKMLTEMYENVKAETMLNRTLGLDLKFALADNDLPKVTRMCELAGVDVCFPLLDHDLVIFSTQLATDLKLKRTSLRYFFKRALRDFLPRQVLHKQKHGFGLPFGIWLQSHKRLSELANDSLHDLASREIVRQEFMKELIERRMPEHPHYYGTMVWVLMMLEQWFKHHVD